jgi:hypothetical protein
MNAACHDASTDRVRAGRRSRTKRPKRGGDVARAGYAVDVSEYDGAVASALRRAAGRAPDGAGRTAVGVTREDAAIGAVARANERAE